MNCNIKCECESGRMMIGASIYKWHDDFMGDFEIKALSEEYIFCRECGNEILAYSLMKRIEIVEQERIEQLLFQSVGNDIKLFKGCLVAFDKLPQLLGKSRQAIQRDGRIKTLIFNFEFCGKRYYWLDSVLKFRDTGDGRYNLDVKIKE